MKLDLVLCRRRPGVLWPCHSPGPEGGGMAAALRWASPNFFLSLLYTHVNKRFFLTITGATLCKRNAFSL